MAAGVAFGLIFLMKTKQVAKRMLRRVEKLADAVTARINEKFGELEAGMAAEHLRWCDYV